MFCPARGTEHSKRRTNRTTAVPGGATGNRRLCPGGHTGRDAPTRIVSPRSIGGQAARPRNELNVFINAADAKVLDEIASDMGASPDHVVALAIRFLGMSRFLNNHVHGVVQPVGDPRDE
jgi:hypothetical protein